MPLLNMQMKKKTIKNDFLKRLYDFDSTWLIINVDLDPTFSFVNKNVRKSKLASWYRSAI